MLQIIIVEYHGYEKKNCFVAVTKQNGLLNQASVDHVNTLRVEDAITNSYWSACWTIVAQIQSRIIARRCAANLVILEVFRVTEVARVEEFYSRSYRSK